MSVQKTFYGKTLSGESVDKFIITNIRGMTAEILTYGATLESLFVADKNGGFKDILLGFDDIESRIKFADNQGVTVGQYANRIANGRFTLNGKTYDLYKNEKGKTCLHGGDEYSTAIWDGEIISDNAVKFSYFSKDGINGFPGNVNVSVTYTISDDNDLIIDFIGVSDKDTIMNFTNHAYFNLNNDKTTPITNHILQINASNFTPMDADSIPTGEIKPVKDTPFDFTSPKAVGQDIEKDCEQLKLGRGYDHNFCLDHKGGSKVSAVLYSPETGIELTVLTDLPGIQLYTGNFLNGVIGKDKEPMNFRTGLCLETQFFPDSPNKPNFPSCVFKAGQEFKTTTTFSFDVK